MTLCLRLIPSLPSSPHIHIRRVTALLPSHRQSSTWRQSPSSSSFSSMAPPTRPTSSSARRTRSPAQPAGSTAYPQQMDPSLCYAPRIPLRPLPSVTSHNGHLNYPTATAPSPAAGGAQRPRENALGLSGMSPQLGMFPSLR